MNKSRSLFLVLVIFSLRGVGQDESIEALFRVNYSTPLTIELERENAENSIIEPVRKKKKNKNPKVFYGIKTKRAFIRSGRSGTVVTELFHYMKTFEAPDEYTREFYWYDFRKKKIVNSLKPKLKESGILHGPYVKKIGDQVVEEGFFYKGKKHGRWVRLNRNDILQDKEIFWKGWPEESLLGFYDFQRNKLREVIPVKFGERTGTYFAFHEDGSIAATGEYLHGKKIGIWREYYPNRRIKREMMYPAEPFEKNKPPVLTKEWNETGKLIFDRSTSY